MGLMINAEVLGAYNRRGFLTFEFARKKNNHPARLILPEKHDTHSSSPHSKPPKIGRGRFLYLLGGSILTAAGVATGVLKPWELSRQQPIPEISLYYPELEGYPIASQGEFTTSNTHTKWFNLSKTTFNPSIAQATLQSFEDLSKSQKIAYYGESKIPFAFNQRPRKERVIFLIPQDAPSPGWPDVTYSASTTGRFDNGPYITFVRIFQNKSGIPNSKVFTTPELSANKAFSTEICQSSSQIHSLSPEIAGLGQEIICNSYGAAFTLKQMSVSFDQYQAWAKEVLIRKDDKSPSFPLYVLSKQDYDQLPKAGLSINPTSSQK